MTEKKLSKETNSKKRNKDILLVTYIFLGLFLILAIYFSYLVGYGSRDVINNPYNKLQNLLAKSVVRGDVYSSDGELLATTVSDEEGNESRSYPFKKEYCHVIGSVDQGLYGVESAYNFNLLSSDINPLKKMLNDFSDKKDNGNQIITTLDSNLQHAAYQAMEDYNGAAIVMDSNTGAVLAMVSAPDYNPNTIAHDWENLQSQGSSVLLNRATQGLYTPGSIFKFITLYEYLKEGGDASQYSYECTGSITVDGETIRCNNAKAHGTVDLMDSFAYSCNCSFVNIGQQISVKKMQKTCQELLFGKSLPIKLEYNKSSISLTEEDSDFVKALTMFGQGQTLMTPIHAAILVSAIANEGTAMEPYFVQQIKNADGKILRTTQVKNYKTLFDPDMADTLKTYMRSVVEYGTATRLNKFENLTVYGKTGSAEIDSQRNINSWFIGFAEQESSNKNYTIVVVTENVADGISSSPSVTIANQILKVLD